MKKTRAGARREERRMVYDAAVITVSDESFWGRRANEAGPAVEKILEEAGYRVVHTTLLQKEQAQIERELIQAADQMKVALVVTVGGTGLGPRDAAPEATTAVCPRMVPGLGEAMRAAAVTVSPRLLLSRGVAATRGKTMVLNVSGNREAAEVMLRAVLEPVDMALSMLNK